jgi:hypothetical protein
MMWANLFTSTSRFARRRKSHPKRFSVTDATVVCINNSHTLSDTYSLQVAISTVSIPPSLAFQKDSGSAIPASTVQTTILDSKKAKSTLATFQAHYTAFRKLSFESQPPSATGEAVHMAVDGEHLGPDTVTQIGHVSASEYDVEGERSRGSFGDLYGHLRIPLRLNMTPMCIPLPMEGTPLIVLGR